MIVHIMSEAHGLIMQEAFKRVGIYTLLITLLHLTIRAALDALRDKSESWASVLSPSSSNRPISPVSHNATKKECDEERKQGGGNDAFRVTNMLVNLVLGCSGLYFWFALIPKECSDIEKAGLLFKKQTNLENRCISTSFFAEAQAAYQIWSIVMGSIIREQPIMMFHHFAVLSITSLQIYTCMFEYYAVFFFGTVEISSVFLSIMNLFKDHPALAKQNPTCFTVAKILFAASFLMMRVYLWLPMMYDFIRQTVVFFLEKGSLFYGILVALSTTPSIFLTLLQMWWAQKIVHGLYSMIK